MAWLPENRYSDDQIEGHASPLLHTLNQCAYFRHRRVGLKAPSERHATKAISCNSRLLLLPRRRWEVLLAAFFDPSCIGARLANLALVDDIKLAPRGFVARLGEPIRTGIALGAVWWSRRSLSTASQGNVDSSVDHSGNPLSGPTSARHLVGSLGDRSQHRGDKGEDRSPVPPTPLMLVYLTVSELE